MAKRVYISRPLTERFWEKVDRSGGPLVCWPWTHFCTPSGYGWLWRPLGMSRRANRIAWELTYGQIPEGLWVLHTCDNRLCCNPGHMFLGTHAENMADMRRKGRAACGDKNSTRLYPDLVPRGERNGNAILTADDVRFIRSSVAAGMNQTEVGKILGVSNHAVHHVIHGHTWKHVP
jgi:predicted DNA-binding protein (UPF0251 family)